ncbi:GNAT family N-acetyltransferase [Salinisphaera sp. Q1T1-3]|uniref:GNAT family N-acetyltransferase n=1 Tax=Salinisphaera sp. Q1T1-3 TaxID=2321229 RepID=UPI000E71D7BC|nr:N-acetyltransferase [Salinisphaera sp. Q1T1-3]RJS91438.1 N-acetyltransferase [Salinisphaera sp. Q1T1-3]
MGDRSVTVVSPAGPGSAIRSAVPADLDHLWALEQAVFDVDAQSRRSLRWLLMRANADLRVIATPAADDPIAACSITLFRANSRVARLYSIAVAAQARGQGMAGRLLHDAIRRAANRGCRVMRAEARVSNTASRGLFAAAGFTETQRLVAYYPGPADGVRMQRSLEEDDTHG